MVQGSNHLKSLWRLICLKKETTSCVSICKVTVPNHVVPHLRLHGFRLIGLLSLLINALLCYTVLCKFQHTQGAALRTRARHDPGAHALLPHLRSGGHDAVRPAQRGAHRRAAQVRAGALHEHAAEVQGARSSRVNSVCSKKLRGLTF